MFIRPELGGKVQDVYFSLHTVLMRRSFSFVEIRTGDTRHIQQIHIYEPSMHPSPYIITVFVLNA